MRYALEGSVFVGGAVIQWLRDEMRLITDSADSEYYAGKVEDSGGVYIVPAFTGLGAPYWDQYARGTIVGITRGTKHLHIIRAAEESIAYQSLDVVRAMEKDTDTKITELRVDGGATRDGFLLQFQADILNGRITRPLVRETTALGAACLAGLAVGFWRDTAELRALWKEDAVFVPKMTPEKREGLLSFWRRAVDRSRGWALPQGE
jgi:glycerol kinase